MKAVLMIIVTGFFTTWISVKMQNLISTMNIQTILQNLDIIDINLENNILKVRKCKNYIKKDTLMGTWCGRWNLNNGRKVRQKSCINGYWKASGQSRNIKTWPGEYNWGGNAHWDTWYSLFTFLILMLLSSLKLSSMVARWAAMRA